MSTPVHSGTFSLEGQFLKLTTSADALPHLTPLSAPNAITTLNLSGNTLGPEACISIANALSTQKTLQTAQLADIFTSRLLAEIPPALSSLLTALLELPNLHTIDLSDNAFGLNTVGPLVAFLKACVPLKVLVLNNNGLGPHAGTMIADALTELAEKKAAARKAGREVPDLERIVCGRNRLESGSMGAWARALRAHGAGLKEVRMVQNGIRADGIAKLLREGLNECAGLRILDLQDNTFTVTGSMALAEVVGRWKNLTELGVGDCLLGARGSVLVAEALGKTGIVGLRLLKMQYNEVDGKGLKAIVGAAERLKGLGRVELNGNRFAEEDEAVERLRLLLESRKEEAGDEEDDREWGLDELSDLEEESDNEQDEAEEEEDEEDDKKKETILKDADEEEARTVSQKKDEDVDELAQKLGKTEI